MGEMRILGEKGDQKMIWDPKNKDEVEVNKTLFQTLKDKGYKAFKVDKKGDPGKEIKAFDAKAGKIIMVPALVGG